MEEAVFGEIGLAGSIMVMLGAIIALTYLIKLLAPYFKFIRRLEDAEKLILELKEQLETLKDDKGKLHSRIDGLNDNMMNRMDKIIDQNAEIMAQNAKNTERLARVETELKYVIPESKRAKCP